MCIRDSLLGCAYRVSNSRFETSFRHCFWSNISKHGTHLARSIVMYRCLCKILCTVPVDIPTVFRYFAHFRSNERNVRPKRFCGFFLFFFWCSYCNRMSNMWIISCVCLTHFKFSNPVLNHVFNGEESPQQKSLNANLYSV